MYLQRTGIPDFPNVAPSSEIANLCSLTKEIDPSSLPPIRAVVSPQDRYFFRDEHTLIARGSAGKFHLPHGLQALEGSNVISEMLSRIPSHGEDDGFAAHRSMVMGALPFDPSASCDLVVPSFILRSDNSGRAWMTAISSDETTSEKLMLQSLAALRTQQSYRWSPDRFELHSTLSHEEFCSAVDDAIRTILSTSLQKVVLARDVIVECNRELVLPQILERLSALFPSCMVFSLDGFIGATPELLVERIGQQVSSRPLAGTIAHSGDPAMDRNAEAALMASDKDRSEHGFVARGVADILSAYCTSIDAPNSPTLLRLRNVSHLATAIEGKLAVGHSTPDALGLAAALHPTPAVAGSPTATALDYLAKHESLDRGCYAGPVGWMDSAGEGEWWVGIRSAEVSGSRARLFAGVGIVEGSSATAELAETQLKLQALLATIVRP